MFASLPIGLAAIVVLGIGAQWIAWRLRLPGILALLVAGILAGPEASGLVDPDALFGSLLFPLVSLCVGILLFEGGLSLHLPELGEHTRVVFRLVTIGAVVTWIIATLGARLLLDFDWSLSVLLGAVLTVTGPTVVLPLLLQIRPTGPVGPILKWEGILIDPVGAVLAVLVYEGMLAATVGAATRGTLVSIVLTLVAGSAIGLIAAGLLVQLLRRFWLPDHLHSPVALALAVAAFAASNAVQHESGLLAVTLMGAALANQSLVSIRHILEFKESVRVLVISALFIILAARLRLEDILSLQAGAFVFVGLIILVARPLTVLVATRGSTLEPREKAFLSAMAPRGIVAATVASVFALGLEEAGLGTGQLVPVVFLVIIGTVLVYGLGAGPLAKRLGLAVPRPQGVLMVGAHPFARALAELLRKQETPVLLVDTNSQNIAAARMAGLPVHHGNPLADEGAGELELAGLGRILALTRNDEVNALCALHFIHIFGRREVYQLPPESGERAEVAPHLRGRYLFHPDASHVALERRIAAGERLKATPLTEQFDFAAWRTRYGTEALPLLTIDDNGVVEMLRAKDFVDPEPGRTLVALVANDV